MKIKVCDVCGKQLPYRDLISEKTQKYTIKMSVSNDFNGYPEYDRYLNFCRDCKKRIEGVLDEILREKPETVTVNLYDD